MHFYGHGYTLYFEEITIYKFFSFNFNGLLLQFYTSISLDSRNFYENFYGNIFDKLD